MTRQQPVPADQGDLPANAVSDRAPPLWRAVLGILARLPQGAISRGTGRLADIRVPRPLRRPLYGAFSAAAGIDLDEAARPLGEYPTFDAFFVRRLRPDARRWPADAHSIASPVDGTIGQLGTARDDVLMQAKGRPYSAAGLLDDPAEAARFEGGSFLTLYLSPRDYHRIHTPMPGVVRKARHVPGALLPVNEPAVRHIAALFPRNERVISYVDGAAGRCAVVAVGAFNVGRIEVVFDPEWRSNRRDARARDVLYDPPVERSLGEELMIFHLGSTVVLLFESGRATLDPGLRAGDVVRLGQPIASAAV